MEKGDRVKFSVLQAGDYFSNNDGQKYFKIQGNDLVLPDKSLITINAFHIQSHAPCSISLDEKFTFILHSDVVDNKLFRLSEPESELENKLEFFTDYLEILNSSLDLETNASLCLHFYDGNPISYDHDEFMNLLRASFFISLYSFLENQLNQECQYSQKNDPKIKVSLNDIQGKGINRAKTYLVKILNCSFLFESDPLWEKIKWFNKIRNCIVHNDGQIVDNELKKYIESQTNIEYQNIFNFDYIVLGEGFCENAIEVIGTFLKSLMYYREADNIF